MTTRTLLAIVAAASVSSEGSAAPVLNERCPVEPTELAVERYQLEHRGRVISFCCDDCVDEFLRSPETYLPELPDLAPAGGDDGERSGMLVAIDTVWNAGTRVAGLSIGIAVIGLLLLARLALGRLASQTPLNRLVRGATSARGLGVLLLLTLGGEAISAHWQRLHSLQQEAEDELEHDIHYTTYQEYGDPPTPARPDREPRLADVYYRGNDERNPALSNGGHYRTATFHIDLCDAAGSALGHGDPASAEGLFLRVRFDRAPETPDYFWKDERMADIYATRDAGRFHGRAGPLADLTPMRTLSPMSSWEFQYPLLPFAAGPATAPLRGIVYLCERRFDDRGATIGGRFHYAFQFDLRFEGGRLSPASDLWMGPLYRKRSLRIWEIPEREWLSREPIPVNAGDRPTDDPRLLGIEAYENDRN